MATRRNLPRGKFQRSLFDSSSDTFIERASPRGSRRRESCTFLHRIAGDARVRKRVVRPWRDWPKLEEPRRFARIRNRVARITRGSARRARNAALATRVPFVSMTVPHGFPGADFVSLQ